MKKFVAFLLLVSMTFLFTGCKASDVSITLVAVSSAAQVAVPVILANNSTLPQDTKNLITAYLKSVSEAVVKTSSELTSTDDTDSMKITKIVGFFSGAVMPNLPVGTPQNVAVCLSAVSQAVETFLNALQAQQPKTLKAGVGVSPSVKLDPLNSRDQKNISKAVAEAIDVLNKLK
jgi:hypothetical protein